MTLTLTVGTNTYISLADAETYMEGRYEPSGAWAAASNATKNTLLVTATASIDRMTWLGEKSVSTQALEFPRDGYTTADTEYTLVENACVEQALWMLTQGNNPRSAMQAQGVRSVSVGGVSESWAAGGTPPLCTAAREFLRAWYVRCGVLV